MTTKNQTNQGCLTSVLQVFGLRSKERILDKLPYRLRDEFLSPAELSFYRVLESNLESEFEICVKVRLADIFYVVQPNRNLSYFNRIAQRHVDYLLCQPDTMKPLLALELDDSSHQRADRQERDDYVDDAFKAANLPLLRIPAQRTYNTHELVTRLKPYLSEHPDLVTYQSEALIITDDTDAQVANPNCPKCGAPMVLRTASKGEYKGRQIYGCSTFPKCRGVLPR